MENTNNTNVSTFVEEMKALEDQLNNAELNSQQQENETKDQIDNSKKAKEKSLLDLIIEEEGLDLQQIETWKTQYGKVYAVRYDEHETYIYRYLTRPEYKQVQQKVDALRNNQNVDLEYLADEMIFDKCVLYPKVQDPNFKATIKAGTIPTTAFQIRLSSNFLPDTVAVELISKL